MKKIQGNVKALIVDDVRAPRRVLKHLLIELGIKNVDEVGSADEATSLLKKNYYNLVFCDFHLGEKKGIDVLKEYRDTTKGLDTPFIMITSDLMREDLEASYEAGVSGYMLKPFSIHQVQDAIADSFEKHNLSFD